MRGRRRLGDALAGAAGELLAHVLDHLPLPRDEFQHLGQVLADLVQNPAAAWAGRRYRIDALRAADARAGTTRWFASLEAEHLDPCARSRYLRGCLGLGSILL
jgi:hypothetical protein